MEDALNYLQGIWRHVDCRKSVAHGGGASGGFCCLAIRCAYVHKRVSTHLVMFNLDTALASSLVSTPLLAPSALAVDVPPALFVLALSALSTAGRSCLLSSDH